MDSNGRRFQPIYKCSEGNANSNDNNISKKLPLPPIEPPPEFQDSPTLNLVKKPLASGSALRWTYSNISLDQLKKTRTDFIRDLENKDLCTNDRLLRNLMKYNQPDVDINFKSVTFKHFYCSDFVLAYNSGKPHGGTKFPVTDYVDKSVDQFKMHSPGKVSGKPPSDSLLEMNQSACSHYAENCELSKDTENYQDLNNCFHFETNLPHTPLKSALCCSKPGVLFNGKRPQSRNSLSSRLSSSHNSLCIASANKADDSIFITQAMSHDALLANEISDFYNVPLDSDIYAFPVDMIRSQKLLYKEIKPCNRDDNCYHCEESTTQGPPKISCTESTSKLVKRKRIKSSDFKFPHNNFVDHSLNDNHKKLVFPFNRSSKSMMLDDVKSLYQSVYCNSSTDELLKRAINVDLDTIGSSQTVMGVPKTRYFSENTPKETNVFCLSKDKKINKTNQKSSSEIKCFQLKEKEKTINIPTVTTMTKKHMHLEKKFHFNLNLKQKLCSIFRFRRNYIRYRGRNPSKLEQNLIESFEGNKNKFQSRALPPVPRRGDLECALGSKLIENVSETPELHFTASIEKVKDYGWYWGPLSCEAAEKLLSREPDGSFIVRDSSDDHYIFSLSFKLNNCVRHVRIEQDQGTFSFGSYAKFKSQTITEFIEKAVEHSRSGRYLFFLHRRPEHGPMRVQLTNPVSRFKHVQSLQHMCRFVILKVVIRKDLVQSLPLPRRLLDYLSYKHCFSEQIECESAHFQISGEGVT